MNARSSLKVLRNKVANRIINIAHEDILLVSYPRSGNTWTKMMMCNLLFPEEEIDFVRMHQIIPDLTLKSSLELRKLPSPRIFKSHTWYDSDFSNVIYICRDPRDVMVSLYHYLKSTKRIAEDHTFDGFIISYLHKWPKEETWEYHVQSWINNNKSKAERLLLLRYETMLEDTFSQAKRICDFLNIGRSNRDISYAVEAASFSKLRRLEDEGAHGPLNETYRFYRKGTSGQWPEYFSEAMLRRFTSRVGPTMENIGYQCDLEKTL